MAREGSEAALSDSFLSLSVLSPKNDVLLAPSTFRNETFLRMYSLLLFHRKKDDCALKREWFCEP